MKNMLLFFLLTLFFDLLKLEAQNKNYLIQVQTGYATASFDSQESRDPNILINFSPTENFSHQHQTFFHTISFGKALNKHFYYGLGFQYSPSTLESYRESDEQFLNSIYPDTTFLMIMRTLKTTFTNSRNLAPSAYLQYVLPLTKRLTIATDVIIQYNFRKESLYSKVKADSPDGYELVSTLEEGIEAGTLTPLDEYYSEKHPLITKSQAFSIALQSTLRYDIIQDKLGASLTFVGLNYAFKKEEKIKLSPWLVGFYFEM